MNRPLVSVIVPVYNAERYIQECLNSILLQTLDSFEVIVVDDGSSDNSRQIIESFRSTKVRYLFQNNAGQSAAINKGVSVSSGTFLKIVDADDWINPDHLANQLRAIEGRKDAVACCQWGYFREDVEKIAVRKEATNRDYLSPLEWLVDSLTLDEGMMGGWLWLIHRELWDKVSGYDERLGLQNDFYFSIALLLAANEVRFSNGAVYGYRKGVTTSISCVPGRRSMESAFLGNMLGIDLLLKHEPSERIKRIAADRLQSWLYRFYPEFPDLAIETENKISQLGGSKVAMNGGMLSRLLLPILGWKRVRRLQSLVYRCGWSWILLQKSKARLSDID